jgi:hypothetical protein
MHNIRNVIVCMCVAMIMMGLCMSCSYSQKIPSEEFIKNVIFTYESNSIDSSPYHYNAHSTGITNNDVKISNLKISNFEIINSFFPKTTSVGAESNPYCIEVNYKLTYIKTTNFVNWKNKTVNRYLKSIRDYGGINSTDSYSQHMINTINKSIADIKQIPDIKEENKEIIRDNVRLCFVQKGDNWDSYKEVGVNK